MNPTSTTSIFLARLGRVVFPRRLWVGLAVVVLTGLLVRPRPIHAPYQVHATAAGLVLVAAGLMGRAWAAGCAGRHTREARIEAPQLITGGPYAYVRNPIYLASIVLGVGMVLLIGDPWLLAIHIAVCLLLYVSIVPAEEEFLRGKFGDEYQRYFAAVPRIWPRLTPWREASPAGFDPRALLDQMRLGVILVLIYAGLQLAAWLRG